MMYWWPNLYGWVGTYVRTCARCQRVQPSAHAIAPLVILPVHKGCWKYISMNFVFDLPKDMDGNTNIVVFVDRCSNMAQLAGGAGHDRWCWYAKLFINRVVCQHRLPLVIMLDRDPRFTSKFWKSIFQVLGTK